MKVKALVTVMLLSISLIGCSKKENNTIVETKSAEEESKSVRLEADEISEETSLASKFGKIDFSEYMYDSSPARLIKALRRDMFSGDIIGLSENIDDTIDFKDLDEKVLKPKVDDNGDWEISMKVTDDEIFNNSDKLVVHDDGMVEIIMRLDSPYYSNTFKIGDKEFTKEELMSDKCAEDLERIFPTFKYREGSHYSASLGVLDANTNMRYNIVLNSEFPTQFNNNKGRIDYSVTYYQMGHDIIDNLAGNLDAIKKREEDRQNKITNVINDRENAANEAYDDEILHITLKTGDEISLKKLVDLGSKDNILKELDKYKNVEYSYIKDKETYKFGSLNELMQDTNYKDESINVKGLMTGGYLSIDNNEVILHTMLTKKVTKCDFKVANMDIDSKNGKKLLKEWDLKSKGFSDGTLDFEFVKKQASYKVQVEFRKDFEKLSRIKITKD